MGDQISVRTKKGTAPTKAHEKLVRLLLEQEDLPFQLPSFIPWPTGERRITERAIVLMLAGLEHLEKNYPKGNVDSEKRVGAETSGGPQPSRVSNTPAGW
jgi:hypothetical protein